MAKFRTTPIREAVYFFYKPLLVLAQTSAPQVSALVSIPEETLRSHVYWYRQKHGGKELAAQHAEEFMKENRKAFDEFHCQMKSINPNQLLPMIYGLYHGYDASFVRFARYRPGQWNKEFKSQHGYEPIGVFPYCGVVGMQSVKGSDLVTIYPNS